MKTSSICTYNYPLDISHKPSVLIINKQSEISKASGELHTIDKTLLKCRRHIACENPVPHLGHKLLRAISWKKGLFFLIFRGISQSRAVNSLTHNSRMLMIGNIFTYKCFSMKSWTGLRSKLLQYEVAFTIRG